MSALYAALANEEIEYLVDYDLSQASTFRIGGKADIAVFPKNENELIFAITLAKEYNIKFEIIGLGSNVLFSDDGFRGAIIFTKKMNSVILKGETISAMCGAKLFTVSSMARDASLVGFEFAHGIPGTVGGAVAMNAGAYGGEISDILIESRYYDTNTNKIVDLSKEEHQFAYRSSIYSKNKSIICLNATFKLKHGLKDEINAKIKNNSDSRIKSQPIEYPSCGSYFKRPEGYFAAKLIDDAGLKGRSVGGACVSTKHAGFIINSGGATSKDVLELAQIVKNAVYEQFDVQLEPEVKYID